jgi:cysteine-rich repeat protein
MRSGSEADPAGSHPSGHALLAAAAVLTLLLVPLVAQAGVFSFTRTDYLLDENRPVGGLGSVAVGDLDGKNGPDIVSENYALNGGVGTINVLLNNGDGTFAPAQQFPTCDGASGVVLGQFNPATDSHLDVALVCDSGTRLGRMLGDGQGNLGAVEKIDPTYVSGASPAASIGFLRLGAMNGPTLVYAGYIAPISYTLCFLEVSHFEYDLDVSPNFFQPVCDVHFNDIVGDPHFGEIDDIGPISGDLAVGPIAPNPDDPLNRDEALSGSGSFPVGLAVTAYSPFYASTWSYGERASGNHQSVVAIADLDGDLQNDLLVGGAVAGGGGEIVDYVPGYPIEQGATPTHTFASIDYLYEMVTADFDGDGNVDLAVLGDDDFDDDGATLGIQRGNGDGTFAAHERFPVRGYEVGEDLGLQYLAVADFNRDGKPDLVTVGEIDEYASVLLNTTAVAPPCGNGVLDAGEQCDDGNTVAGDCCSATCQFESNGATCDASVPIGCSCNATGQCLTAAAAACPFVAKTIGAAGGTLALPDGSVTVTVPAGAVATPTNFSITGLVTSAFGIGTDASRVEVVDLAPAGVNFAVPVGLRFRWPDTAPADGVVDGLGVDETTLKLYKNGVAITGQCGGVTYQPASCTAACCDTAANTWSIDVSSFSEYVLDAASCATFAKPKLTLGKILPPGGDDVLAFAGNLPSPATPPDPDLHGLTIVLTDANGSVAAPTLPAGLYDKSTKTGWKVDKKRTKWTWSHAKEGAPSGIVKAVVALNVKKRLLTIALKGAQGTFAATAPVTLSVGFPAIGDCGTTGFDAPDQACSVKSKGKKLVCK